MEFLKEHFWFYYDYIVFIVYNKFVYITFIKHLYIDLCAGFLLVWGFSNILLNISLWVFFFCYKYVVEK